MDPALVQFCTEYIAGHVRNMSEPAELVQSHHQFDIFLIWNCSIDRHAFSKNYFEDPHS